MITIILIVLITLASFYLAKRSMHNFEEDLLLDVSYGVYLIRNPYAITVALLQDIGRISLKYRYRRFSIEKLYKGSESAIVCCIPRVVAEELERFYLLEIEDYLESHLGRSKNSDYKSPKIALDESLNFVLTKKDSKQIISKTFPTQFRLTPSQRLCWQIVLNQYKKEQFKLACRILIAEPDIHARISVSKEVENVITSQTDFKKLSLEMSQGSIFEDYRERSLGQHSFEVEEKEIAVLLGIPLSL